MIKVETSEVFTLNEPDTSEPCDFFMSDAESESYAGKHLIVDFWGGKGLDDCAFIESAMREAALSAGATLLHIHLHTFNQGGGVTGVALLAESHISVHTWPERNFAAFDIFMCGQAKPEMAVKVLEEAFKPERITLNTLKRGSESTTQV